MLFLGLVISVKNAISHLHVGLCDDVRGKKLCFSSALCFFCARGLWQCHDKKVARAIIYGERSTKSGKWVALKKCRPQINGNICPWKVFHFFLPPSPSEAPHSPWKEKPKKLSEQAWKRFKLTTLSEDKDLNKGVSSTLREPKRLSWASRRRVPWDFDRGILGDEVYPET